MNPLNIPSPVPYEQQRREAVAEQATMSREDIKKQLAETSEAIFDPENLPRRTHNWVDRGLKVSCEGADHPHHEVWKRMPKK